MVDKYAIEHEPAMVEPVDGSDRLRITLRSRPRGGSASRRRRSSSAATGLAVPYDAVFIDAHGELLGLHEPGAARVRPPRRSSIEREEAGDALLPTGRRPGTQVVTVGRPGAVRPEDAVAH